MDLQPIILVIFKYLSHFKEIVNLKWCEPLFSRTILYCFLSLNVNSTIEINCTHLQCFETSQTKQ